MPGKWKVFNKDLLKTTEGRTLESKLRVGENQVRYPAFWFRSRGVRRGSPLAAW